jgi:hypothetical protein
MQPFYSQLMIETKMNPTITFSEPNKEFVSMNKLIDR